MKKLNEKEWKGFPLGEIFNNFHGHRLNINERQPGKIPMLTAGAADNGVSAFISNRNMPTHENFISIDMFGCSFYHPYTATGDDNIYFFENDAIANDMKRFISVAIEKQSLKFSYGKQFRQKNADALRIMLPVTDSGEPDYAYMAAYVQQKRDAMLAKYRAYVEERIAELGEAVEIPALDEKEWHEYALEELFSVGSGKRLTNADKIDGNRPFVGATDNSNGITGFVGNRNTSCDKNVLGVNYNGAPCIAFYHPYECIFTDDVKRLHLLHHKDNEYVLLFFKAIVMQQRTKYSYGYKFKEKRMLRQKLMIPVDDDGKPDYAYMEQYAKNMMLKKYEQYLAFLDKREMGEGN